jgi:two-component system sensor histidine kinase KdpD
MVVYVETSRHSFLSEAARRDIAQALELAESMGGETLTATGEDVAAEVIRIAREHNVSTIIIGKSIRSLWSRLTRPSVASAILDQGDGFDIMLMSNRDTNRPSGPETNKMASANEDKFWRPDWPAYSKTVFIVAMASFVAWGAAHLIATAFLPFLYLIAIFMVVLDLGLALSAFATLLSVVALDLIMTMPDLSWLPTKREDILSLIFFLVIGLTISVIGDRLHRQTKVTRRNAERTQSLYDFAKSIAAAATIDDVAQVTVRRVAMALATKTLLLLPRNERLEIVAAVPADLRLDTASNAAMDWAWRHGKPAGFRSDTLPSAPFYGVPLQVGSQTIGILAVQLENQGNLSSDQNHFLKSLGYQAASAIERAKLVTDVAQARLNSETEKLRASLLSSISHDLRVPLDSIIMAARSLSNGWSDINPTEQRSLIALIEKQSDRLDRFVQNLLDMTELVTGAVHLNLELVDLRALIQSALTRLAPQLGSRPVNFTFADGLPSIEGDPNILRRVFVNIIENACTYSPFDQPITIVGRQEGTDIKIAISDRGAGIPESERERVFDMFYRIKSGATHHSINGAGLGLSICRGFIGAHQGQISARSGDDGIGTKIVVRLPVKTQN